MDNIPHVVYHYCSLEAFLSIINNNTIRLTNISKSNDRDEIRYCFNSFEKTLSESCKEFAKRHIKTKKVKKFFDEINYSELVSRAVLNDSLMYYVACFSAEADLLSQWRGYANDGKGVAIGFYSENFINASNLKNIEYNKIIYDMDDAKIKLHDYIISKLEVAYVNAANKSSKFSAYENAINDIISKMVYNAIFNKNPAFKEESEWRLVFYPFGNIRNLSIAHKYVDMASNYLFYDRMFEIIEYEKNYHGLLRKELNFRCTEDKLLSYVDVNFESVKEKMIGEIVIGPKSDIDDNDLRLFLMKNGYDLSKINIRRSTATYR